METGRKSPKTRSRNKLLLGNLPDDFLRFDSVQNDPNAPFSSQVANDEQTALALQHQYFNGFNAQPVNVRGRIDVTVTEARLVKNYGVITKMDPYLRLRVGHHIYETKTCYNGSKNPKWNKVFHCFLPNGVDVINIEIYDECAFSNDERIAWAIYAIPKAVFDGETIEEFIPLNGKQGEGKEGTVGVVLSFTLMPASSAIFQVPFQSAGAHPSNADAQVQKQSQEQEPPITIDEGDIKQVQEMFPSVDIEVIRTIMDTQRGSKERAINVLLQMNSDS